MGYSGALLWWNIRQSSRVFPHFYVLFLFMVFILPSALFLLSFYAIFTVLLLKKVMDEFHDDEDDDVIVDGWVRTEVGVGAGLGESWGY